MSLYLKLSVGAIVLICIYGMALFSPTLDKGQAFQTTPTPLPDLAYLDILRVPPAIEEGCQKLCWLGFSPDDTEHQEFLVAMGNLFDIDLQGAEIRVNDDIVGYTLGFELSNIAYENPSFSSIFMTFTFAEDTLYKIDIQLDQFDQELDLWPLYSPPNILKNYGKPSYFMITPGPTYSLWFIYEELGFYAEYIGVVNSEKDSSGEFLNTYCFTSENFFWATFTIAGNNDESVLEATSNLRGFQDRTIEALANIDADQLVEEIISDNNTCIQIPTDAFYE